MGYLSSGVIAHNGGLANIFKKSINPVMNNNKYPNNLKLIREFRGFSQEALAELAHTKRTQIYKLESGERKLTHPWMMRLAVPLKCKASDFIESPGKLVLDGDQEILRDSEIALIDAIKDIIQLMTLTNANIPHMLRNAFSFQRAAYEDGEMPAAVQVMETLGRFVGETGQETEQTLIRRLLQIAPVGSA